jgi:uncharacterized protein with HEPN domain
MPPDIAKLLLDMQRAVERIERFAAGKTFADYQTDDFLRSAIERQFEIIGEAMTRLANAAPDAAARITDYRKITGFRNVLIHGYDTIDDTITWGVVTTKLPLLKTELDRLIAD